VVAAMAKVRALVFSTDFGKKSMFILIPF